MRRVSWLLVSLLALFSLGFSCVEARAEIKIDIAGAKKDPLPVAIPDFSAETAKEKELSKQIIEVVSADLVRSGLFSIVDKNSYIQSFDSINVQPNFTDWQAIKSQALVQGRVKVIGANSVRVEFRLWDVFAMSQMQGQAFTTEITNWRRISHMIADDIYERITGENGYFDTRIVYIAETGIATNRIKRLAIMDQDGENHKFLTNGEAMVLTPRFSPTVQQIVYMSYYHDTPRVYIFDIETGRQERLGDFPGMTFAPRFSPDGKSVIMSMSKNGNSEIYVMNLSSKKAKRITYHPAIDTSPCFSPDGEQIVFNSDRGGNQQLYVMEKDGSKVKRISFGEGRYATPVWSPRGDYIAFTKMLNGRFYIGVMHPDGSGERLLSEDYLVEGPTWSPNGRVLMYFRESRTGRKSHSPTKIYSIDLTGYNERQVITPVEASDPAWSPLLP